MLCPRVPDKTMPYVNGIRIFWQLMCGKLKCMANSLTMLSNYSRMKSKLEVVLCQHLLSTYYVCNPVLSSGHGVSKRGKRDYKDEEGSMEPIPAVNTVELERQTWYTWIRAGLLKPEHGDLLSGTWDSAFLAGFLVMLRLLDHPLTSKARMAGCELDMLGGQVDSLMRGWLLMLSWPD